MKASPQCTDCLTKYVSSDLCRGCRYHEGDRNLPSLMATQSTISSNRLKERTAQHEAARKERERLMNERMAKAKEERDERMRKMEEQRQERMVQMKLRQEKAVAYQEERKKVYEEEQRKRILKYREELGLGPEVNDADVLKVKLDSLYADARKKYGYREIINSPADADPSLVSSSRPINRYGRPAKTDLDFVEVLGEMGKSLHKFYLNCEKGYDKVINWFKT